MTSTAPPAEIAIASRRARASRSAEASPMRLRRARALARRALVPTFGLLAGGAVHDALTLLTLENAGLQARLHASRAELRASRMRMFAAGAAERRRIERDLHDGAQNRLVALRIELGLAAEQAAELGADDLRGTLVALGDEMQEALDGVRAIAHGIYPPLLAGRGLRDALEAEAARAPIPIRFAGGGLRRSTHDAEAAVYFCCLEAIQNASKHAGPRARVAVRLRCERERLAFSVVDDGAGFDSRAAGASAGLMHVRDRISAVGGDVDVTSAPGRGTTLAGTAPWPPREARA
jgi:signal transduction histidine kinase